MNNYYHYDGWNVEQEKDGKYTVLDYRDPDGIKYTFGTKWAADEMCRFCRATDPPPLQSTGGLIINNQYSLGRTIQFGGVTVAVFDDKGNVTKFDLPYLVRLWFQNTSTYKLIMNIPVFCKKLWYGDKNY